MNNPPLIWHPQWLVYHHGEQGVVLINKTDMVWLPYEQFVGIEHIDGIRTDMDIGAMFVTSQSKPIQGALFWHQLSKLMQSELVTKNSQLVPFYQQPCKQEVSLLCATDNVAAFSLSDNDNGWLNDLAEILVEAYSVPIADASLDDNGKTALLLVDDFLYSQIVKQVSELADEYTKVIMVEVAPQLGFSHCLKRNSFEQTWSQITARLWDNQPVRKAFANMYPQQCNDIPVLLFDVPIAAATKQWLIDNLVNYYQADEAFMLYVDIGAIEQQESEIAQKHRFFLTNARSDSFTKQIAQPVTLSSCESVFDSDGGSRAMTPEQTVARLLPLVSEKTGVITHLQAFDDEPDNPIKIYRSGFFKTPTPRQCQHIESDLFSQACMGKGVSSIQSQASALCETIERYNALYRGDVNTICLSQSALELSHQCIGYAQLLPYSAAQYANFADENHPDSQLKQAAKPYDDSEVHWLPCWSLNTKEQIYVPLSLCFSQVPFADERFGRWGSNGCAAGNRLEEAILQGLLELIERDATAIWWYNRSVRQGFDLSRLDGDNLAKLDESLSRTHKYWVLDVTTDIGIPAMVAVGQDKQTNGFILGMGCHISPELAAQRALTELCQLIPIRDQNGAPFDFDAIEKAAYLYPENDNGMSDIVQHCHNKDIKAQVEFIVTSLARLDMDTVALNYSRAHVPLYTAKVFVPGLSHIWPQLANQRLYQTPVNMGLVEQALNETQINPLALYI